MLSLSASCYVNGSSHSDWLCAFECRSRMTGLVKKHPLNESANIKKKNSNDANQINKLPSSPHTIQPVIAWSESFT